MHDHEELYRTAIHEAGHAVVAMNFPYLDRIDFAEINDNGSGSVHYCYFRDSDIFSVRAHYGRWWELAVCFGGFVGEILILGKARTLNSAGDFELAFEKVNSVAGTITPWPISSDLTFETKRVFKRSFSDKEQLAFKIAYAQAKRILSENRSKLLILGAKLYERKRMSGQEIVQLLNRS